MINRAFQTLDVCSRPAFITGTSTEFLGSRPLPRVVRSRALLFVFGERGSGKSTVALKIAGPDALHLRSRACQQAIVDRVRATCWSPKLLASDGLILDGPVWLQRRPGAVQLLTELLSLRLQNNKRTVICQADTDASVGTLLEQVPPGSSATLALRFPSSRKARLRAAHRICDQLGHPHGLARGTASLPNWSYTSVKKVLSNPVIR